MKKDDRNLIADDGKILTNGVDYGTTVSLGNGVSEEKYREITREEYDEILREKNQLLIGNIDGKEV